MEEKVIGKEIIMLSVLVKRKILAICGDDGLGQNGHMITYILSRKEDTFQRDIENHFKLRRSTVTIALNKMEKKGFIIRQPVENDNRLKKIVVTEKAKEIHERFLVKANELENKLASKLTNKEIQDFYSIADKLKEILDD